MTENFGPQFEDERALAARQIVPKLMRFIRKSMLLLLAQVCVVGLLLSGIYFKKTEAFGVTQSGQVFKLERWGRR